MKRDVVLLKIFNIKNQLEPGQIVTLKCPTDPSKNLIKRVAGVEGQFMKSKNLKTGQIE
jgi:hypothetical protein